MKRSILLSGLVMLLAAATASAGVISFNYYSTRMVEVGGGPPGTGSDTRISVGGQTDYTILDFDRAAILADLEGLVSTAYGISFHFTDPGEFAAAHVCVSLSLMPSSDWESVAAPDGNMFSFAFAPAVRLSNGQDWVESQATFNQAATGQPWHDGCGSPMATANGDASSGGIAKMRSSNFMVVNATSELWGLADQNGGFDKYGYNQLRPWRLDTSVAWAALKNPDAVGFELIEDTARDGTTGCLGRVYSRYAGIEECRPMLTVTIGPPDPGFPPHPWPLSPAEGDFDGDQKVSFKDYIILEGNFGKTHAIGAMGDADGDGVVSFKDFIILEANFGRTPSPEPASITLLLAGGLALLRRRA